MNRSLAWISSLALTLALGAALSGCSSGSRTPNTAPAIDSSPITTATVGQPYRYELEVSGEPHPIGFTAKNLPAWLTLDGPVLSGTPGLADLGTTGRILVVVSNGTEPDARQSFRIAVGHEGPLFELTPSATAGSLSAPAGLAPADFTVHSAYGTTSPAADGSFSLPTRGAQLIWATRGGKVQLLGVAGSVLGDELSPRSTAATLAFLNAGLTTAPSAQWGEGLQAALADAKVGDLQQALAGVISADEDVLASQAVQTQVLAAAQSLAGSLNQRADAAVAPVSSSTIDQRFRVTPALPRSGLMVDTGREQLLNDRRRTVFAAMTPQGQQAALADFEALPGARPGAEFDALDETWKGFRSEGGVSILPPERDLLLTFEDPYQVTLVGASLRTNLWPAAGSTERSLMSRALTTDAAQHHLEALSLALGFEMSELGGARELIAQGAATQAWQDGVALEDRLSATREPGLWTLLEAFEAALAQGTLSQPYESLLRESVGGLEPARLDAARSILGQLATAQRGLTPQDSPALLYQTASDPVVTFQVDPTRPGADGGLTIVLEWGDTPGDLDSHLVGPSNSSGRFHLYYPGAETSAGSPEPGHVALDLDDTDAYGPETTAILAPEAGVYRFTVFDYSNQGDANSLALQDSRATVKVYRNGNPTPIATYQAPRGAGNLWSVFEYEGATGELRPVGTIGFVANEAAIGN